MRVEDAVQQTRSGRFRVWPVVDKEYFLGIVTRETLECADVDGRKEQPLADLVETPMFRTSTQIMPCIWRSNA